MYFKDSLENKIEIRWNQVAPKNKKIGTMLAKRIRRAVFHNDAPYKFQIQPINIKIESVL